MSQRHVQPVAHAPSSSFPLPLITPKVRPRTRSSNDTRMFCLANHASILSRRRIPLVDQRVHLATSATTSISSQKATRGTLLAADTNHSERQKVGDASIAFCAGFLITLLCGFKWTASLEFSWMRGPEPCGKMLPKLHSRKFHQPCRLVRPEMNGCRTTEGHRRKDSPCLFLNVRQSCNSSGVMLGISWTLPRKRHQQRQQRGLPPMHEEQRAPAAQMQQPATAISPRQVHPRDHLLRPRE